MTAPGLIDEILLRARLSRPYFARALAALTPVAVAGVGSVAVDRWWRLYYDPAWLEALSDRAQVGVIACHEIEHLLRDHASRGSAYTAAARNICADAEINDDADPLDLPPHPVLPNTLGCADHLTLEDYLLSLPALSHGADGVCGGGSGAGRTLECELPPDGGVTTSEAESLRDATAAAVRDHVAEHGRGSVPSGTLIWAEARRQPVQIDWRRELAAVLRRSGQQERGRSDYTYARPARRQRAGMPLRPATMTRALRIAIVVDTSGSMGAYGGIVIATVESLARRAGDVDVIQCDAAIQRARRGEWLGGGGTDLRPAIAAARGSRRDLVVVVTDGDTPWPERVSGLAIVMIHDGEVSLRSTP